MYSLMTTLRLLLIRAGALQPMSVIHEFDNEAAIKFEWRGQKYIATLRKG